MNILEWEEIISKPIEEQVEIINKVIQSNSKMTISDISKNIFNQPESMVSKHLTSNGYSYRNKQYAVNPKKSNQKITENVYMNEENKKVINSKDMITLNMYSLINEILVDMDSKETDRATIKISKETSKKLEVFLKEHKILKKQDIMSVAIELFLNHFD